MVGIRDEQDSSDDDDDELQSDDGSDGSDGSGHWRTVRVDRLRRKDDPKPMQYLNHHRQQWHNDVG